MGTVYLTHEGLNKLKIELRELVKVIRPEATIDLATAREHGDLSENAEYDAARENLNDIDRRIYELQKNLSNVEIIEENSIRSDEIRVLCKVMLENLGNGSKIDYTLVDPLQSDPAKKRISLKSPIGKGLLGKRVGDEVTINVPSGKIHFKVLSIDRVNGL
ncbi:MAG: transcription elongation factor GreA [Candidatus Hatepunaea meridiana]|nr:transcription elongation factor GreA [Candidatus Hatepunaea meridiana]